MAFASGARTQLRYILESTYGEVPGAGNCTNIRRIDDSLVYNPTFNRSREIRSDRQVSDTTLVNATTEGTVDAELSYREYDPFLESALQESFDEYGTSGTTSAFLVDDFTANTIEVAGDLGVDDSFTNLVAGQGLLIEDPAEGPNDGKYVYVSLSVAPTATVLTLEGTPLSVEASVANVTLSSSFLKNGVTQTSFSLEREHADITQFLTMPGMTLDSMSLSLSTGATAEASFSFMGSSQTIGATTLLPGTPVASQSYDVMNAVDGVVDLSIGGAVANCFMQDLELEINNNLRGRSAIGTLGYCDIGSGTFEATGKFTAYFADAVAYNLFLNQTRTLISFTLKDAAGNGYMFMMPSVKYSSGQIVAGDKDSDSVVEFEFEALLDPVVAYTMAISRVGA